MRAAVGTFDDPEILSELTRVQKFYFQATGGISAVLTTAAAENAVALDFDKAGFADEDWILIGDGANAQLTRIDSIPVDASPIPVKIPAEWDYAIGTKVRKVLMIDVGYIEESSVSLGGSSTSASVGAANSGGIIWTGRPRTGLLTAAWNQRASSLENILSSFGIDETTKKGTGVANDPYRCRIHPDVIGTQALFGYLLSGLRADASSLYFPLLNCRPTVNIQTAFGALDQPATWAVGVNYTHTLPWVE